VFGSKLKEQVEDRLKFYETGLILFYIAIVSSGEPAVMKFSQLAGVGIYRSYLVEFESGEKNTSLNT
jgi:hypothetical protein